MTVEKDQGIVLKRPEMAITTITCGQFELQYGSGQHYHHFGISSCILTIQFLAQLLLVSRGTISGQIMFITSLSCSRLYNSYISTLNLERPVSCPLAKVSLAPQLPFRDILFRHTDLSKPLLSARSCLRVKKRERSVDQTLLKNTIAKFFPNNSASCCKWKDIVLQEIWSRVERGSLERFEDGWARRVIGENTADLEENRLALKYSVILSEETEVAFQRNHEYKNRWANLI